ncbi:MAG TPA: TIGR01777 family oxidoreductase [Anaerolineales bacterium]|nr:TIGR01777 family oxidoreductase [Anaerolineales bacterium]
MRVIITGGTGLLGKSLIPEMVSGGYEVIVLSRNPQKYRGLFSDGVRLEAWDARTADGWGTLADGAAAIINLAGENLAGYSFFPKRWTDPRKRLIRESRLQAGQAVVAAVESAPVKPSVVVQVSAVGYYGPQGDREISEADPPASDFLAQVAVEWEMTTRGVEAMGVRHVVVRGAGFFLSKDSGALPRLLLPSRMFVGGPMGNGKQWYTWIHPGDASRAIRFLIEKENVVGPFNLVSPQPLRSRDFSKAVGKAMGRPSWLPVPGFALELGFGEVSSVVLTGQKVFPARLLETGFQFEFPEAVGAIKDVLRGD